MNTTGTYACPVCGRKDQHQHPASAIRWHADYLPRFLKVAASAWPHCASAGYIPNDDKAVGIGDGIEFFHPEVQKLWLMFCSGVLTEMDKKSSAQEVKP